MTNEMVLERKSNLVMPTHYVELDEEEMSYVKGGAFWWVCDALSIGIGIASVICDACGESEWSRGLSYASLAVGIFGAVGSRSKSIIGWFKKLFK